MQSTNINTTSTSESNKAESKVLPANPIPTGDNSKPAPGHSVERQFQFGRGARGGVSGKAPTAEEKSSAYERLEKGFNTTTEAVEYLLDQGWSISAICDTIRYGTQTTGHAVGDKLRPQHVNHIRTRWLSKKVS